MSSAAVSTAFTPSTRAERRNSIVAGTIGNFVEWFDWSMYGFFTPIIAAQFFPTFDKTAQLLSGFAIFAVGFFVRPLGGAVLGSYADRHGRRSALTLTIVLMAAGSLAMALIPGYRAIGVAAPVLLVLARCLQGFSAGGEFGSSSAFLVENAEAGKRASVGAWQQVSVGGGTLLASLLAAVMFATLTPQQLGQWGFRAAFVLAAVVGLVGLYLRLRVPETDAFRQTVSERQVAKAPLLSVLSRYPRETLTVIALVAAGTGLVQLWFLGLPSLANLRTGIPLKAAQPAAMLGLLAFTVLQPLSGWLSDRYGRKPLLLVFALGSAATIAPCLLLLRPTFWGIALPAIISGVFLAAYAGSLAAVMAEQFPAAVRTAGISLPYGIAVAIFGGLTPNFALAMQAKGKLIVFVAVFVVLCLVTAVFFARMRETSRERM